MQSQSSSLIFYAGEFRHNLDTKLRLKVPSKWRFADHEPLSYLAFPDPLGCITVYPPEMVGLLREKVSAISLGDMQGQRTLIALLAAAESFSVDKNGRIHLSQKLYEHAAVEKEVVLIGTLNKFQLWSPDAYSACLQTSSEQKDLSEILRDLGL